MMRFLSANTLRYREAEEQLERAKIMRPIKSPGWVIFRILRTGRALYGDCENRSTYRNDAYREHILTSNRPPMTAAGPT